MDRKDIGSWLSGPPRSSHNRWPGERLGRPAAGPGSVGRLGRRLIAIIIDWVLCYAIAAAFLGDTGMAVLGLFAVEQIVLIGTLGYSIGHRIMGLQVQRMDGRPAGFAAAVVRTILLCLLLPAVVFDPDQRGVHDRAMDTILVRI